MDDDYFQDLDQQDIQGIQDEDDAPVAPDEAEEAVETVRVVKPKKIVTKPRLKLDDIRLKGPRGLSVLEDVLRRAELRGPGHERRDLDTVLSLLEHWAHRLFPRLGFDDCLQRIEELGHKKSVSSYVTLLRSGCADTPVEEMAPDDGVRSRSPSPRPTVDPFDQLLDPPPQSQLSQEQRDRMERNKLLALERRRARLKARYEKPSSDTQPSDSIQESASPQADLSTPEGSSHPLPAQDPPDKVISQDEVPTEINLPHLISDLNADPVQTGDVLDGVLTNEAQADPHLSSTKSDLMERPH